MKQETIEEIKLAIIEIDKMATFGPLAGEPKRSRLIMKALVEVGEAINRLAKDK